MKTKRAAKNILVFFLLLSLVLIILSSCAKADKSELEALRVLSGSMADALMNRDADTAVLLFDTEYISEEEGKDTFIKICDHVGSFSEFEVKDMTGYNVKSSTEYSYTNATFFVDTDAEDFYISITKMSDSDKVCGLSVQLEADEALSYTGTLTKMQGASVSQWIVLLLGLAVMVFSLWMFVDCAKSRIERKVLWLLIILLGFLSITFTFIPNESVKLFFSIGFIFSSSTLKVFSTGLVRLFIALPIGAFVYFLKRDDLKASAEKKRARPSAGEDKEEPKEGVSEEKTEDKAEQ